MVESPKISGKSYYDNMPSLDMGAGDIWKGLPCFGNLRRQTCSGLVITPACDLSNRKVETVTFVPVISVEDYLQERGFAIEYVRVVREQAPIAGLARLDGWESKGASLPTEQAIESVLKGISSATGCGEKVRVARSRVQAAARILLAARSKGACSGLRDVCAALSEKGYATLLSQIVRNAYSSDIHFLPRDGRAGNSSAMELNSVALFRYPMAIPIEILDIASDLLVADWSAALSSLAVEHPIATHAVHERPLKVSTLRPRFLADLLSRFAGLHIRMGSPDFSKNTVDEFVEDFEVNK